VEVQFKLGIFQPGLKNTGGVVAFHFVRSPTALRTQFTAQLPDWFSPRPPLSSAKNWGGPTTVSAGGKVGNGWSEIQRLLYETKAMEIVMKYEIS